MVKLYCKNVTLKDLKTSDNIVLNRDEVEVALYLGTATQHYIQHINLPPDGSVLLL